MRGSMGRKAMAGAVAAGVLLLTVGVGDSASALQTYSRPAGDVVPAAMNKEQAVRALQRAFCPAYEAIDVAIAAQEDDASWDVQSGMNYVLGGAGSVEEYDALVKGLQPLAPGLARMADADQAAWKAITRRLGLTSETFCKGYS